MTSRIALAVWLGTATVPGTSLARADDRVDVKAAEQQFLKSCGTCHAIEPNAPLRQGPNLRSAFGRTAATLEEFSGYSPALKAAGSGGLIWTESTLDKWITSAAELVPGSTMPYAQADADKRKLVIGYLKSLAEGGGAKSAN